MFVSSSVCVFPSPSVRYHGELWDVNICTNNQSFRDECEWPGVARSACSVVERWSLMGLNRDSSGESFGAEAMNSGEHQEWWHPYIHINHLKCHHYFNSRNFIMTWYLNWCHCQKELTDYIKKKRRFVLVAVTSIFVVTTIIMVMSVIHVEMNQTIVGYEECCMSFYHIFGWIVTFYRSWFALRMMKSV